MLQTIMFDYLAQESKMKVSGSIIHKNIEDLTDDHMLVLLDELHQIRRQYRSGMLLHFLQATMNPWKEQEPYKNVPLTKQEVMLSHYLTRKLGDLYGTTIYTMCRELKNAFAPSKSIEDYHGNRLYVCINKLVPRSTSMKRTILQ